MVIRRRVVSFLAHTRFVPTPVYRLMVLAWLISGVLQLLYGAPASVQSSSGTGSWFDWVFVGLQLLGSAMVLVGLYLVEGNAEHATKLHRSLTFELLGLIFLQTVVAWQIAASTFYQGRIPSAGTTWMSIVLAVWFLFRQRDIVLAQRMLGRKR